MLTSPASAVAARVGTWSGYGHAMPGNASLSGPVSFSDGRNSTCSASVTSLTTGYVSCSGDVAFAVSCVPVPGVEMLTLACPDIARNLYVEAVAVALSTGRFAGTVSYERL